MKINIETIIAKFNELDIKARYAALGGVLVLVFMIDYLLIMQFQLKFLQNSNAEINTLSVDTARVQADKQRVHQMRQGLESSRTQLKAMNVKIRSVGEVPSILDDISRLANEVGVKIDQLVPRKETQETLITSPEGNFYALPIDIQAHGGYHAWGRFLNRMEGANLYFSLSDLRIVGDVKDRNNQLITATLKVILTDKAAAEAKP